MDCCGDWNMGSHTFEVWGDEAELFAIDSADKKVYFRGNASDPDENLNFETKTT